MKSIGSNWTKLTGSNQIKLDHIDLLRFIEPTHCTLCVYEFSQSKLKLLNDQIKKIHFQVDEFEQRNFFLVNQNFTYRVSHSEMRDSKWL